MAKKDYTEFVKPAMYLGVAVIAYFGVVRPLFKKFGIIKGEEEKNVENFKADVAFDPKFWQQTKLPSLGLKKDYAIKLAVRIKDAFGVTGDDEAAIYAVFKALKTKFAVSQVAYYYNAAYKQDLFNELKDRLSAEEMNTVIDIVKKLPTNK